jgi:uncharacterized protein (TIGR02300 family)
MVEPALGIKRHCQSCGENYYDLNKSPITCPHCQAGFDPEVLLKSRKSKPVAVAAPKKTEEVAEATKEVIDEVLSDDIESTDGDVVAGEEILEDDADIAVITPAKGDEEIVSTEEAIEDELDAPEELEE